MPYLVFCRGGIFSSGKNLSDNATNNTYSAEDSRAASDTWENHAATSFAGGTGAENDPWLISSAEELAYLAKTCNNGEMYSGKYFKQTADIYLGGYDWVPIGKSEGNGSFKAVYDGNYFSIYNMYMADIDSSRESVGLFGRTGVSVIKNVSIKQSVIDATGINYVGAFVGFSDARSTFENCKVEANIIGDTGVGGIAGISWNSKFINCKFSGSITAQTYAGGIVGQVLASNVGGNNQFVESCINLGNITAVSHYAGGIVGQYGPAASAYPAPRLANCYNNGIIKGFADVGGIAGEAGNSEVMNCMSEGVVDGTDIVGGLIGQTHEDTTVRDCMSKSYIIIHTANTAGGIVGQFRGKLENCCFIGGSNLFTAGNFYGGKYDNNATITSCYAIMNRVKGYSSKGDFSGFAVSADFNDGYPVQKSLYHVANFMPQATRAWFAEQGYGSVKE